MNELCERLHEIIREQRATNNYSLLLSNIKYLRMKKIRKIFFKNFFESLCLLDLELSLEHEITSEEDWEALQESYDTPIEMNLEVRKDISTFTVGFQEIRKVIKNMKISSVLKTFDKFVVPSCINLRNMQFILFDLCERNYDKVFGFFIKRCSENKKFKKYYISIISTLLVRYKKIKENYKEIILRWLYKNTKKDFCEVEIQFFLYALIFFNKEDFIEKYENYAKKIFEKYGKRINFFVCSMFSNVFGKKKVKSIKRCENEVLNNFVFDRPILERIALIYDDIYNKFEN